jgi:hypothetical protein
VYPLPANLREMQVAALARASVGRACATFLKTRHQICMRCVLGGKTPQPLRLRLDTLRQTLICSACMGDELASIDLVGRVLRHKRQHLVLCPSCVRVQVYSGQEQLWAGASECAHQPLSRDVPGTRCKGPCVVCAEPAQHTVERVDHLTGQMRQFRFCQRHIPRLDALASCVNARQMDAYCP